MRCDATRGEKENWLGAAVKKRGGVVVSASVGWETERSREFIVSVYKSPDEYEYH